MAFLSRSKGLESIYLTILLCIVFATLIYYDKTMNTQISITDEIKKTTKYDLWTTYDESIAYLKPNGKTRSIMLLHAYVPFWNAGSEVCAHTVNRFLIRKGHEVWVGVPGYPNRIYEGVYLFDSNNRALLHGLMKYTDVIGTHSYRQKCLTLSHQYGAAFIDWFHGGTYTSSVRNNYIDKENPKVWAAFNSTSLYTTFQNIDEKKYTILRPPVDWHEYEIPENLLQHKYVTLSNLNENKGGQILIDIARAAPEIQFLGVRGSYWKQIEDHTLTNLTYIDNTPKIKDIYMLTNILIMPSKEETWGRTAVEAMSSGIPVISAITPGLKECCEDAALFVERTDIKEWVRLIRRLTQDSGFYEEYAKRGKARARQLEPTHDLETYLDWYETKVVPSVDRLKAKPPNLLEKYLDIY
jgi:glycosyltransferase involved in cell wall biosynthesis